MLVLGRNNDIEVDLMFADERGLHIRMDATSISSLYDLQKVTRMIRRPVVVDGIISSEKAFVWLTIPMRTQEPGSLDFTNGPTGK